MLTFLFRFIQLTLEKGIKYDIHRNITYRKVFLSKDLSPIKCPAQFQNFHDEIKKEFANAAKFDLRLYNNKHIFMFLEKNKMIGYCEVQELDLKTSFSGIFDYIRYKVGCPNITKGYAFYSVVISDSYKNMQFSRSLMEYAVEELKKLNKNKFLLMLHLNSKDKYMPISTRMYYTMGFTKTRWCRNSSEDYAKNINVFLTQNDDMYDVIYGKTEGRGDGAYLGTFCYSDKFKRKYEDLKVKDDFYNKTKEFMETMDARRRIYGDEDVL